MNDNCHNLDDYLAGDLPTGDVAVFTTHLHSCEACREAIAEQQWIDGLLKSRLRSQLEPLPPDVLTTVQTTLAPRAKQQSKLLPAALAVAAALLVAAGWTVLNWRANDTAVRETAQTDVANPTPALAPTPAKDQPRATFVSNSATIVVPVESHHADVSIVRIYPTYKPRYEARTAAIEPEAATNKDWNIYSNGG